MEKKQELSMLLKDALEGNKVSLEQLLLRCEDMVFNLSLRMLGTVPDAEDATQEILIKVMTHLSSFRGESSVTTWVFRIAYNYLKSCQKGMFCKRPLSFEVYGEDILSGREKDVPDMAGGVDRALLEEELKYSCTNVMLQCLDPESRCVYILGTMFRADSRVAGDILGITPEAYRQRLSRVRARMAEFLREYCGLSGMGKCACKRRVDYAIATKRIQPQALSFQSLEPEGRVLLDFKAAMEEMDEMALIFSAFPMYRATERSRAFLNKVLHSSAYATITNPEGGGGNE